MNVKKMFASLAGVLMLAQAAAPMVTGAATYSDELQGAYDYAYGVGITTMNSIDNANMYWDLTRGQLSKMISQWAEKEMGVKADTTAVCSFTDTDTAEGDLATYVVKSCQMGLMGQGIEKFRPGDKVTRGEFGTVLSRAIWGDKYDGENPYYAKHLQALKDAGIMTNISDPNATEMRGWVMLMLERAAETVNPSECNDPAVLLACSLGSDSCPAACKDNEAEVDDKGNIVVKSGDLSVTATAATERKAILDNSISDLDTITLKASEKITVDSITLERFGYSTVDDVDAIWLEDGEGNKIADEKSLSSTKDTVTLKIKKEYREMDESNALTIVLRTTKFDTAVGCYGTDANCTKKPGTTIWFKVTEVDASAKNLDITDYNPYTYDLVSYDGTRVTVNAKGNSKTYNYEAKEFYEVSRLKVQAGASVLALNWITLTNKWAFSAKAAAGETPYADVSDCPAVMWYTPTFATATCSYSKTALDLSDFVSAVKVTADGKEVSGLKFNVTKDNELVLSWDTIEVDINKNVQLVVSIAMEWLDEFGKVVRLELADNGDLKATEKKTGARVSVTTPRSEAYKVYFFNGSKIKLSNTKLSSNIDAAQWSEDVVIAKGTVTVGEEVKINELEFTATNANSKKIIDAMTLDIAGESYDASVSANNTKFTFKNVIIEKSWDFELLVDVIDNEDIVGESVSITINGSTSISKTIFTDNARYEDSREDVKDADVSGSISISSLKVQESKASLKNNNSKTVEFVKGETSDRVTLFKGTYTAKKADITLKEFAIVDPTGNTKTNINNVKANNSTAEFYLYVNGEEVGQIDETDIKASADNFDDYTDLSDDIEVAAGKSVDIEVKAVVSPYNASNTNINFDLYLRAQDKNGTSAGFAKAGLQTFKYVLNGSLTISDSVTLSKKTVALKDNEITVAKFTLKPSKSDSVKLDNLVFDFAGLWYTNGSTLRSTIDQNVTVTVDGTEIDLLNEGSPVNTDPSYAIAANYVVYDASDVNDIDEEVEVEVKVKWLEATATVGADIANVADYNTYYWTNITSSEFTALSAAAKKENSYISPVSLVLKSVNGITSNSTYSRLILPAVIAFDSQESDGGVTKFRVSVDDYEGEQISNLKLYTTSIGAWEGEAGLVSNWATIEVSNQTKSEIVDHITFNIVKDGITYLVDLTNSAYPDFFKTTSKWETLRVSKID